MKIILTIVLIISLIAFGYIFFKDNKNYIDYKVDTLKPAYEWATYVCHNADGVEVPCKS